MTPEETVAAIEERGGTVRLSNDGKLIVAPGSCLTPRLREAIVANKAAILAMLSAPEDLSDDGALLGRLVNLAGGRSDLEPLRAAAEPFSSGLPFFCSAPGCSALGPGLPGFVERYTSTGDPRCSGHQEPWPAASAAYLAQIGL